MEWAFVHTWWSCSTLSSPNGCFGNRSFWIQKYHEVSILWLLVATNVEVCEGVCWIVWYLCTCKESSPSTTLVPSVIAYPSIAMVFHLHGFIIDLPPFHSFDSILVVVDHLTKMVHFIPCNKTITSKKTSKLFLDHVFWYHGILENIIYNNGPQFVSKFWRRLFELLGVKMKLSSNFHPQMDGQMEHVN